jgi:hypothetical protein
MNPTLGWQNKGQKRSRCNWPHTSLNPLAISSAVACFSSTEAAERNLPKSMRGMRKGAFLEAYEVRTSVKVVVYIAQQHTHLGMGRETPR